MTRTITSLSFAAVALTASALQAIAAEPLKLENSFTNRTSGPPDSIG